MKINRISHYFGNLAALLGFSVALISILYPVLIVDYMSTIIYDNKPYTFLWFDDFQKSIVPGLQTKTQLLVFTCTITSILCIVGNSIWFPFYVKNKEEKLKGLSRMIKIKQTEQSILAKELDIRKRAQLS